MKRRRTRKRLAWLAFDGSRRLFEACWRELLAFERDSDVVDDVAAFLDGAAARRVNDPNSTFYIHGD